MDDKTTEQKDKMTCRKEGCINRRSKVAYGRHSSLCERHRHERYGKLKEYTHRPKGVLKSLTRTPCYKCGWNLSYTDRHRIIPGKDGGWYTPENTVSLCPNCHRIETHGLLESVPITIKESTYKDKPENMTCVVSGCTNRRSNAGYGRYRKVCEKHHRMKVTA